MRKFATPIIVISKCLEFDACRYNGEMILDDTVRRLVPFVEFVPICPEVEIGLGIPRNPIRIVIKAGQRRLIQPSTGKDLTKEMEAFRQSFLSSIREVDGFILKSRSPSCGITDVKMYETEEHSSPTQLSNGMFTEAVLASFGHKAVEDENRLKDATIREFFLIKIFTLAEFREVKQAKSLPQLIQFHSNHKYLFMAFSPKQLKAMGNTVANHQKLPITETLNRYEQQLVELLQRPYTYTANVNALQHIMGYVSDHLSSEEKHSFLDSLEKYKDKQIPLRYPLNKLKAWVFRFEMDYLMKQSIFEPYPLQLLTTKE